MAKHPNWTRDELILALDVYFQIGQKNVDKKHPEIIKLSQFLRQLAGINQDNPSTYRNARGVASKMMNFKAIDPDYPGSGFGHGSKLDPTVFNEFADNQEELHALASLIRKTVTKESGLYKPYSTVDELPDEEEMQVREGKVVFRLHQQKERNQYVVRKKKATVLRKTGKLACEVCDFDFVAFYGDLGEGFIECHHKQPLSELDEETVTKPNDLALVCANCHRMLHRGGITLSVVELRKLMGKR